jgi:MFS family permease
VSTTGLGIILGTFLVGVGVFQVPAGFAAMRWGARRVSLLGVGTMGITCALSGFSPNWYWLAGLRFAAGVGAAFFFSPALSLIASYYPAGSRGPVIGLYNGGFSIGGAIGLVGAAVIGAAFGWTWALAGGGIALVIVTAVAAVLLPKQKTEEGIQDRGILRADRRAILRSRSIWALSVSLVGFWAAIFVVAQYFIEYVTVAHASWTIFVAATMVTLVVVVSFPGGPVGGWLAERGRDRRTLLILFGGVSGMVVAAIPFTPFLLLWPSLIALGFFDGMTFAILYLIPSYLSESRGQGVALGVGVVNSVQVLAGSFLAVLFGFLAAVEGYTVAWLFAGALTVALLPLALLVTPNRATRLGTGVRPAPGAEIVVGVRPP